jgi:hypothetical protein
MVSHLNDVALCLPFYQRIKKIGNVKLNTHVQSPKDTWIK